MNTVYNHCKICGKELLGRQQNFCSIKCKNKYFQSYENQVQRANKKRAELVRKFGGKCSFCGYKSSVSTLVFLKNYEPVHLRGREFANHDLDYLCQKVEGASLVCKNCVSEVENNDIEPRTISKKFDIKKFNHNIKKLHLKNSQSLVLGVSGGIDSVIMLDLFYSAGFKNVIVAHLNHGVRKAAVKDQEFVKNLAKYYNYVFETRTISAPKTGNLENELRILRRKFLLELAAKHKAEYVVLAHNSNDQVETILLNLVRGSGAAGMSGMSMSEGKIIRPLLNFSRDEIENYARKNNLKWAEDITNRDIKYKRNYVRHKILPLLSEINPEFLETISRSAILFGDINNHLRAEAQAIIGGSNKISIEKIRNLDKVILYQVFIELYERILGSREELELKHLQKIEDLIRTISGTKEINLPNGIVAERKYSTLEFFQKKEDNISSNKEKKLKIGDVKFNNWRLKVTEVAEAKASTDKMSLYIDKSFLANLRVKNWSKGDKIEKEGLHGAKKLQDLFTDAKIDRDSRKKWPVITYKDKIIWLPGLAFSRNIKITDNNLIKITARKEVDEK